MRLQFHPVRAKGRTRPQKVGMNKLEADYALHLDRRKHIDQIAWRSEHEALKLKLANNTWYIVDFLVMRADGVLEIHDTKGTTKRAVIKDGQEIGKTETYFCEMKNKTKLKLVAEHYPIVVRIIWRSKAGEWMEEEL